MILAVVMHGANIQDRDGAKLAKWIPRSHPLAVDSSTYRSHRHDTVCIFDGKTIMNPTACQHPDADAATDEWIVWQMLDSAFPTGGFAHSAGLEAAAQQGELTSDETLASFFETSLLQTGRAALPLVLAARREPNRFAELDELCETMLRSTVPNRASRAQGQAYLVAVERAFAGPDRPAAAKLTELRAQVRRNRLPGHFTPAFGACAGLLGFTPMATAMSFLFLTLRGLVSSAVRLGLIGPMQAQAMQFEISPFARWVAHRFIDTPVTEAAQSAPIIDILQGGHDRLYSRLFQS